ncbi:kinase-like domain-containing protein [Jimgerdemannia flammicorona]|uniref:Kinase-like domain-containing protein n=1 Tax=Jimgerdemannia flammicorona TaxID=994334 RepID=A0A433CWD9_9FUNG|nr:kinase-like domain-containing protein [Jimgerdemannia flammicorona]
MAILSSQINAAIVIYGLTQRPDGTYLMVSSILSFGNLESRLETMSEEQHTWDFVFEQALCICRNVRQFHDLGFVHNDLHPGNVLLDHPLSSTIVDFGLSRSLSYKSDDGVYGRLAYLPPEVFRAEPLTKESDVYCIGTLMWQLVSRVTPTGTAGKLREDGMREEFVPGMPPVYEGIIRDCWNIVPEKRPKIDELCQRMFDAFDECRPQYISGEPRNSGNQTASSSEFTPTNPTTVDNTTAAPRNPEDEHHKTTSHTLCTHDGSDTDSDDSIVIIDMDDTLHFQEPPRGMSNETRTYIAERMAAYRRDLAAENADGSNGSFDFAITSDAYVSGASVIDRSQFYSQKQLTELLADPVA